MNRRVLLALVFASCVAVIVGCSASDTSSRAFSAGQPRREVVSTLVAEFSDQDLVDASRVVMRGRVTGKGVTFSVDYPSGDDRNPSKTETQLFTEWQVTPEKIYKGKDLARTGEPLTVVLRGGLLGDLEQVWEDEASLMVGEKVLLFLAVEGAPGADTSDRFWVQGFYQGKYKLAPDGTAANADSRKTRSLGDLENALVAP